MSCPWHNALHVFAAHHAHDTLLRDEGYAIRAPSLHNMFPEVMFETLLEYFHWHYQINMDTEVIPFWSRFTDSEQRQVRNQLEVFERQHPQTIEELRWSPAVALTYAAATSLRWAFRHTPEGGKYGPVQIKGEDHIQIKGTFLPLHESAALRSTCKTMAEQCLKMHNKGPDLRYMHHSLRCTQNPQWTVNPSERLVQLSMAHVARPLLRFRQQDQSYHAPGESATNLFNIPENRLDDIIQSQINFSTCTSSTWKLTVNKNRPCTNHNSKCR